MTFLFPVSPAWWSIKNISKPLFHLIRSFTKIVEFDNVKFSKSSSSKDGVSKKFLDIDSKSTFSKNEYLENANFFNIIFRRSQ